MGKRIIFLSGNWDSRVDPTVVCTKALLGHFISHGYEVEISTYWGREKKANREQDGYRINYVHPHISLSLFDAYYHSKDNIKKRLYYIAAKIVNTLHRAITITHYPIGSVRFVRRWAKATCSLINPSDETILVSVVNPEDSIYAGYEVKRLNPNVRWIVYYLDCGTNVLPGSTFETFRTILHKKSVRAENNALTIADKVIVMCGHYDYYSTHLTPLNAKKLLMADIPLLCDKPKVAIGNEFVYSDKLNIVYAGTMTGVYYDPKSICELFMAIRQLMPYATLDLYGITDKNAYLNEMTQANCGITYHGTVHHEKLEEVFKNADVLIYYKNQKIDSVSGKFFEYMSYMKPVVYYGIKGDINYNNVLRYSHGLSLDCKEPAKENAERVVSFLQNLENVPLMDYNRVKETFKNNLGSYAYELIVT